MLVCAYAFLPIAFAYALSAYALSRLCFLAHAFLLMLCFAYAFLR